MPEIRTFLNAEVFESAAEDWRVYSGYDTLASFPQKDWDLKLTFTKKAVPIEEGKWYLDMDGDRVFVLALRGDWAWVTCSPKELDTADMAPDMVVNVSTLS